MTVEMLCLVASDLLIASAVIMPVSISRINFLLRFHIIPQVGAPTSHQKVEMTSSLNGHCLRSIILRKPQMGLRDGISHPLAISRYHMVI